MRMAQIVVMGEAGEVVYEGSLKAFIRANEEYPGNLIQSLRDDMAQAHGRPEPTVIGGGAAPMFYVSIAS